MKMISNYKIIEKQANGYTYYSVYAYKDGIEVGFAKFYTLENAVEFCKGSTYDIQ